MKKKKTINLILLIIWMIIIFIMSSFNGNESSYQSNLIVNFISNLFNINNLRLLSLVVRKLAHFTEYLILGILMYNYLCMNKKGVIFILSICIIYALSDEIHQIFISGRVFSLIDILIDTIGAYIGILISKHLFHIS